MNILSELSTKFWSPHIWLPPNTTWEDIAPGSRPDVNHANYKDLIYPIPMAVVLVLIRYIVGKYWLVPVGRSLGIKSSRSKRATPNTILEAAYNQNQHLQHKTVLGLTKQVDMSERQIERWWRLRRAQDKPSTLVKFCENGWRMIYYGAIFLYGIIILWDKSWFWDMNYCWYGIPHQSVDNDVWWYYMIEMSFYWSLTGTQFFDIKRKDFWQMFTHHIVCLLLMSLSWVTNLHRVGSLVLIVHDCADIFLEAAKITKYANYQKCCDIMFGVFTILWIVTRLGFFPRIIYGTSMEAPKIVPMFFAYYIFNGLLIILLCLHILWTYVILQVAYKALKSGQMEGDLRSSSSDITDSSSETTSPRTQQIQTNGTPKKKLLNSSPKLQKNSPKKQKS